MKVGEKMLGKIEQLAASISREKPDKILMLFVLTMQTYNMRPL